MMRPRKLSPRRVTKNSQVTKAATAVAAPRPQSQASSSQDSIFWAQGADRKPSTFNSLSTAQHSTTIQEGGGRTGSAVTHGTTTTPSSSIMLSPPHIKQLQDEHRHGPIILAATGAASGDGSVGPQSSLSLFPATGTPERTSLMTEFTEAAPVVGNLTTLQFPFQSVFEEERRDRESVEVLLVTREEHHVRYSIDQEQDHHFRMVTASAVSQMRECFQHEQFVSRCQALAQEFNHPECIKRRTLCLQAELASTRRELDLFLVLQEEIRKRDQDRDAHASDCRRNIAKERTSILMQMAELQEVKKAHVLSRATMVYDSLPPSPAVPLDTQQQQMINKISSIEEGQQQEGSPTRRAAAPADPGPSAVATIVGNLSSVLLSANETLAKVTEIMEAPSVDPAALTVLSSPPRVR